MFLDYKGGLHGLSLEKNYYKVRNDCLNKFATYYNKTLPLKFTHMEIRQVYP